MRISRLHLPRHRLHFGGVCVLRRLTVAYYLPLYDLFIPGVPFLRVLSCFLSSYHRSYSMSADGTSHGSLGEDAQSIEA